MHKAVIRFEYDSLDIERNTAFLDALHQTAPYAVKIIKHVFASADEFYVAQADYIVLTRYGVEFVVLHNKMKNFTPSGYALFIELNTYKACMTHHTLVGSILKIALAGTLTMCLHNAIHQS